MVPGAAAVGGPGGRTRARSLAGSRTYLFSEDRDAAFQEALRIGYAGEYSLSPAPDQEPAPSFDCRFAEVEYLEELGMGRTSFEVYLGEKSAREAIGFDHQFDPAAHVPEPIL